MYGFVSDIERTNRCRRLNIELYLDTHTTRQLILLPQPKVSEKEHGNTVNVLYPQ